LRAVGFVTAPFEKENVTFVSLSRNPLRAMAEPTLLPPATEVTSSPKNTKDGGCTLTVTDAVEPLTFPVRVADVAESTALATTRKRTELDPAGTVCVDGVTRGPVAENEIGTGAPTWPLRVAVTRNLFPAMGDFTAVAREVILGRNTVKVADRLDPVAGSVAVRVTCMSVLTGLLVNVKLVAVPPSEIVTCGIGVTTEDEEAKLIFIPPTGAGAESPTVPEPETPPTMEDRARLRDVTAGSSTNFMYSGPAELLAVT